MRSSILIPLLFITTVVSSQNLTGVWHGKRLQTTGGCFPSYALELHIHYAKDHSFMGMAYNYYDLQHYTKINFKGRYNPTTKRLVIIENAVLDYQIPPNCVPCIKTYDLIWTKDSVERMIGDWKGFQMGSSDICPPGTISLTKSNKSVFSVEIIQNDTLSFIQKNRNLFLREKDLVKTIEIEHPEIKIELFDNGEIDGDTVSVYLNNLLIMHHRMLSYKPVVYETTLFPNVDYEFLMYAENLGKIPPNTALMVITSGDHKYEMRIASSEQKSAVVRFRYNE